MKDPEKTLSDWTDDYDYDHTYDDDGDRPTLAQYLARRQAYEEQLTDSQRTALRAFVKFQGRGEA